MGCSETFPFSVNGYLFQWNSQKLWSDLFFLFFSHILSEYCQLLPSNKFRIQTLLTTLAATTPEQATIIFHQDTCCHRLSGLCTSCLLFYSLTLTLHKSDQCSHCSSAENPLTASHFTPKNFPAALHPYRQSATSMPSLPPVLPPHPYCSSHSRQLPALQT